MNKKNSHLENQNMVQDFVDILNKNNLSELEYEAKDFKIKIISNRHNNSSNFQQTIIPALNEIIHILKHLVRSNKNTVMISFTHGQPAVPTTVGKELLVFLYLPIVPSTSG